MNIFLKQPVPSASEIKRIIKEATLRSLPLRRCQIISLYLLAYLIWVFLCCQIVILELLATEWA